MSVTLGVVLCAAMASAADPPVFTRLQKLVGTWEAKRPDGKMSTTEVTSVSAGSALMIVQPDEGYGSMITMIHPDGDRVLLTHYCSAKNQPRMVAEAMPDGKTIKFKFLDVTNLSEGQPGHMRDLVLTLPDNDHMSQEWHFRGADGKDVTETFNLVRKK
ncbi:MAG TPA: hypothetical protein VMS96_12655 [Terriglobales bacterium]|nr:hypothetical protein [Terriglobales bacterium]